MLKQLDSPHRREIEWHLIGDRALEGQGEPEEVLRQFAHYVMPQIDESIFRPFSKYWTERQQEIWQIAKEISETSQWNSPTERPSLFQFRDLASVMAISRFLHTSGDALAEIFWEIYEKIFDHDRPEWMEGESHWSFCEKELPSLRPTILNDDGVKVPTNGQLVTELINALDHRKKPWTELEFLFGSDTLLKVTERRDKNLKQKIEEREDAKKELRAFLTNQTVVKKKWSFRHFSGPPTFGAFFDWEEPGGRIHISSQLRGIDIRSCPASDHVWQDTTPTRAYQHYAEMLSHLRQRSKLIGVCLCGTLRIT